MEKSYNCDFIKTKMEENYINYNLYIRRICNFTKNEGLNGIHDFLNFNLQK